jgi:sucrose-6-phosphate hydrolase SacC (GH32 family)
LQHGEGTFGGPWLTKIGETYHLWYHGSLIDNLPTQIYHATSDDLVTWRQSSAAPILDRSQSWEVDQVADPSLVEANGRTFLFYDGDDNVGRRAAINVAVADGNLSELFDDPIAGVRYRISQLPWYPGVRSRQGG